MRKPFVTVVDPALASHRFSRLARGIAALGRERRRDSYQTTFWFGFDTPPSNLVEQAVIDLKKHLGTARLERVIGVEWWLSRMRTSNVKVDFHHDRDNAYFARTGKERRPRYSTVLYLNRVKGGLLAVTNQAPNPRNPALAPDVHDFDFVEPGPNRFAFFDAKYTHGVLDARNQIPGQRLPLERTWRLAVAINFWARRPEGVPRFTERTHYRSLAL